MKDLWSYWSSKGASLNAQDLRNLLLTLSGGDELLYIQFWPDDGTWDDEGAQAFDFPTLIFLYDENGTPVRIFEHQPA